MVVISVISRGIVDLSGAFFPRQGRPGTFACCCLPDIKELPKCPFPRGGFREFPIGHVRQCLSCAEFFWEAGAWTSSRGQRQTLLLLEQWTCTVFRGSRWVHHECSALWWPAWSCRRKVLQGQQSLCTVQHSPSVFEARRLLRSSRSKCSNLRLSRFCR